jgi:hypothetical protein
MSIDEAVRGSRYYRRPVPFTALIKVHATIWRAQRGVVYGALVPLVLGLLSVTATMASLPDRVDAAAVSTRFGSFPTIVYSLIWLAVGAIAGAAPFKSGWASVVLTVAPRRGRWLAACLASFLLLTVAVTVLFAALAIVTTGVALTAKGHDPGLALSLGRTALMLTVLVVTQSAVGFLLGAAGRSVTAAIVLGYVVAPAVALARIGSVDLGRWLDLNGALTAITTGHVTAPSLAAIVLWIVVPALIAWSRLRSSVA